MFFYFIKISFSIPFLFKWWQNLSDFPGSYVFYFGVQAEKEFTLTKRKFKYPSFHLNAWKNTEHHGYQSSRKYRRARKGTHHKKCEYSPTESQYCRLMRPYLLFEQGPDIAAPRASGNINYETPILVWGTLQGLWSVWGILWCMMMSSVHSTMVTLE